MRREIITRKSIIKETKIQKCKYCLEVINSGASVCQCCRSKQNWFAHSLQHYGAFWAIIISALGITSGIIFSWSHLNEARQERIKADVAVKRANEALAKAE